MGKKKPSKKTGNFRTDTKGFDLFMVAMRDIIADTLQPVLGDTALGDVDGAAIKSLRDGLLEDGYSDLYAELVRLMLIDVLGLAEEQGAVAENAAMELSSSVGGYANFFQKLESGQAMIEPESFRKLIAHVLRRYVLPIRANAKPGMVLNDAWSEVERIAGDTSSLYVGFVQVVFAEAVVAGHRDGYDPSALFSPAGPMDDPYQNMVTMLENLRESEDGRARFEELVTSDDQDVRNAVLIATLTTRSLSSSICKPWRRTRGCTAT
ncbi:hypothetical protein [Nocardia sp. NPDC050406]|uniref:hypothetical protein n=1 Tax=Nocardia sp. NPDC050406 TaxID=3364318 RepID=UPI0037889521